MFDFLERVNSVLEMRKFGGREIESMQLARDSEDFFKIDLRFDSFRASRQDLCNAISM